jgi:diguanylate cyclase (GGDEF)-like protein
MNSAGSLSAPAQPDLRVLIVGRDDIERSLRRDPALELLRARSGTDAIGELGLARHDHAGAPMCVLLAPGAVEEGGLDGWLDAMRGIDPDARFVSLGGASHPGFDGRIEVGEGADALRRIVNAPPAASAPEADSAPSPSQETESPELPDTALVEASLRGERVLERALAILRRRPGLASVAYLDAEQAPPADGRIATPVVRHEARFGWLVGPAEREGAIAEAAAWLAPWLALEAQRRQLQEAAFTDELTGAWNRRYFMRFLDRALDTARRERRDVTLMVYDIDDFKQYNDAFGHAAGDAILCETTRLLRSVIRPTDRVCRIGGDEFAVIFDDPAGPRAGEGRHPTSIAGIAERFQRQVCAHRFPKLGAEAQGTLTISGGMATFPWDGHDAVSLLERADQLSLESKRQGKNVITLGPGAERVCRVQFGDRSENRP